MSSPRILAGHTIGTPEHLFKKIEEKLADSAKFGGNVTPAPEPALGSKKKGKKVALSR